MNDLEKSYFKRGAAGFLIFLMTASAVFAQSEPLPYYCFEVTFPDGDRNSECGRRERAICEQHIESMRGYAMPGSEFKGCFIPTRVFCYDVKYGGEPLCFTDLSDCETSHKVIPGGSCTVDE